MKNLRTVIQDYKNNPGVETQQMIAKFYIKDKDNRESNKKELLDFFKQDNLEGGIEWYSFFSGDKKFWKEVYLVNEEKSAKKFLKHVLDYKEQTGEIYLKLAIDMCDTCVSRVEEVKGLSGEIEKLWIKVFEQFPQFESELKQAKVEKEKRLKEYLASLNISETKEPETIKVLEIIVPMMNEYEKSIDFNKIANTEEFQEFMNDRVEYFNNFHLQGYINYPQCHSITMRVENNENIFTLKLNAEGDESQLKRELFGQLSDGLGSNLSQSGVIIGDKKHYFDFDIKNAGEFFEIEKKEKKLKIK